jgi:hypothetical protein
MLIKLIILISLLLRMLEECAVCTRKIVYSQMAFYAVLSIKSNMVSIGKYRQYNLTAKIVVTNEDKVMFNVW